MSSPRKPAPNDQPPASPLLAVPRRWLALQTVLVVGPWLVVAAIYWWPMPASTPPAAAPSRAAVETTASSGRWGTLDVTTVVISPPMELVGYEWGRPQDSGRHWFFPATTPEAAESFLLSAGLAPDQVASVMSTMRTDASAGGLVFTPAAELLRGLSPEARSRVYVQLAGSPLNLDQVHAFRYSDESIDAWFGPSLISPATRRFIEPLVYRHGSHLYFADTALVRAQISDPEELRRLAKALLRQKALRVRLKISTSAEVPGLVDYWGRGGRRTDIRPLLESIADDRADSTVDIVHLLPSFAREKLFRYPLLTAQDLNRPALANCLWTSLNFFNLRPDDRYLDVGAAVAALQQNYYLIDNRYELGDIVVLLDEQGNIFHAVVYLADNLVFTKNGTSPMAPWVILPLDTVVDYYRLRSPNPRLLYHRRKDM